jgi:hypothetical protein
LARPAAIRRLLTPLLNENVVFERVVTSGLMIDADS